MIRAEDWKGSRALADYGRDFKVYPALTKRLDSSDLVFTQETINEIILWKVGRYAEVAGDLQRQLQDLKKLRQGEEAKAHGVLTQLLGINGVRLPMASTFLRFANPRMFQIFGRHIYRAIHGRLPPLLSKKPSDCIPFYFTFLRDLRKLCDSVAIPFEVSDRILFIFGKCENPPLGGDPT